MRIHPSQLAKSLAANMLFVLECKDSCGDHHISYITEQSECQYYDAVGSRHNAHFQILEGQLDGYIQSLERKHFSRAEVDPVTGQSSRGGSTSKWYAILSREHNYRLSEITVVNNLLDDPVVGGLASMIPMSDLACRMFIDEYPDLATDGGKRGNLRWDIGYTASNQTDARVVDGMNFPKRLVPNGGKEGIGNDGS